MIGYNSEGRIVLWCHSDILTPKRQYPINHGTLSEQIFLSDFKHNFGGSFNQHFPFKQGKTIHSLMAFLIDIEAT